jgi:glycosyltransferase involved in cell wall biosynthesis
MAVKGSTYFEWSKNPEISIVVPCRNEKDYIGACLESILNQQLPSGNLEVIVADGMSWDGTRQIVMKMAAEDRRIRMVDNPLRTTPSGFNVGIRAARGRYVAILGAHTHYASNYVKICIELLEQRSEVCCSGGPIISQGRSHFGRAVAGVMSHPVGVGNAKHRFPDYEGYAEGACFPIFRKEVFAKVGLYDEIFLRNQDDEFNYRLSRAGEKVFISPRARCTYFVRETPSQLFRQYYQYGFWRVAVLKKHRLPASLRQIVPPLFISMMLLIAILGLTLPGWWRLTALVLPLAYTATLLLVGISQSRKLGWQIAVLFPVAATIMHMAYAAGFLWGLFKNPYRAIQISNNTGECHASRT